MHSNCFGYAPILTSQFLDLVTELLQKFPQILCLRPATDKLRNSMDF
jgi:hypothetical protein